MAHRFCEHLQDYGALFAKAEMSYRLCNELLKDALAEGLGTDQAELLSGAVEEWLRDDGEMRAALVELATTGRVKVPKKKPHATKRHGTIRCSECGFKIIKLKYSEWAISANGLAHFQGKELLEEEMVPAG